MASLSQNYVRELADKNRKYWPIREILPTANTKEVQSSSYFTLHNEEWRYFVILNNSFSICVFISDKSVADEFNVRVGICRESGENVVMSNVIPFYSVHFEIMDLISRSQLDSILQSDELYIFFVEVEKKDEEKERKAKEKKAIEKEMKAKAKACKRKFETDYKELLLSGKKSDLTINVKHRKFNCHSIILGARSPVFSAMMENEMKEQRSSEVFIEDSDPSVFQDFLLYLYTGKEEYLNSDNITGLYKLGDKYFMDDLKYHCTEHMKKNMSIENFFEFFLISQQHNNLELSEAAIEFFLEYSEDIVECEKWADFMKECNDETHVLIKALVKQNTKMKQDIVC